MNLDLSTRRALVCGGSKGIGLAAAGELASLGCSVTLLSRDTDALEAATAKLARTGNAKHDFIVADLSSGAEKVRDAVAARQDSTRPWTILINNTGGPPAGHAIDATSEQLLAAFGSQMIAAQLLTQLLVPGMKSAAFGRVINITSTSVKQPIAGLGISNIVRAAVANWAKSISQELGPLGITVNNVLPGYTATERLASLASGRAKTRGVSEADIEKEWIASIPAGRLGKPEEVGAAIAFLASPAAAYINGINLPVDGGRLGTL